MEVADDGHRIFADASAEGSLRVTRLALMASLRREGERMTTAARFDDIITKAVADLRKAATKGGRCAGDLRRRMMEIADRAERAASEV